MIDDLYRLCYQKGYFTCGTSEQYQRMFDMAERKATAHDVALVIWICSDKEIVLLDVLEREVQEIYDWNS